MRISDIIDGHAVASNKKKRRIFAFLFLLTGILSATFIFVSLYGQYTGSFTMKLSNPETKRGIALSENIQGFDTGGVTRLSFLPMESAVETDFNALVPAHELLILTTDGQYLNGGENFSAYTFYLKNVGDLRASIKFSIRVKDSVNNLHESVRIRFYQTDINNNYIYTDNESKNVKDFYMKEGLDPNSPQSRIFGDEVIDDVNPGEIRKISIVYWVHGPSNFKSEGAVKLEMLFYLDDGDS